MKHQYLVVVLVILIILFGYSYYYSLKEPQTGEITQERATYVVPEERIIPEAPEETPAKEPEAPVEKEVIINIKPGFFDPKEINITPGTTVTWVNEDTRPHKITDTRRRFYGERFLPGESYSYTFNEEGTYYYFDVVFFALKGKIIVEENEDLSAITGGIIYSGTNQRMTGVLVLLIISMIIGTYFWFKEK